MEPCGTFWNVTCKCLRVFDESLLCTMYLHYPHILSLWVDQLFRGIYVVWYVIHWEFYFKNVRCLWFRLTDWGLKLQCWMLGWILIWLPLYYIDITWHYLHFSGLWGRVNLLASQKPEGHSGERVKQVSLQGIQGPGLLPLHIPPRLHFNTVITREISHKRTICRR